MEYLLLRVYYHNHKQAIKSLRTESNYFNSFCGKKIVYSASVVNESQQGPCPPILLNRQKKIVHKREIALEDRRCYYYQRYLPYVWLWLLVQRILARRYVRYSSIAFSLLKKGTDSENVW